MAEQVNLKLPYVVRQNISSNPKMTGKWYGRIWKKALLDTKGLAKHMTEHGLVRNEGRVYSVLSKLSECIPELLSQGVGVKIDGLGTFYPAIESRGEVDPTKFSASKHIKGIKLHILPWSERADSLTSKSLLAKAELEYMGEVQTITQGNQSRIILIRPEDEDEE